LKFNNTIKIIFITAIVIVSYLLLFVIEYENNININGKVISENEWILSKRPDGSLISTLYDHKNNRIKNTTTFQIDRGDVFGFTINHNLLNKEFISALDTIGYIQSSKTSLELAQLEKQLSIASGNLLINLTGTKEILIIQAQKELDLARERSELQNKMYKKQSVLFKNELISEDEFDYEENIQKIYELQAKIAESNLNNLQTGSKPEQIQRIQEEIVGVENEIRILKDKIEKFTLISPLDGNLYKVFSNDTIVFIGSKEKIAVIPFDVKYNNEIKSGQKVSIYFSQINESINGTILEINKVVRYVNNIQSNIATVELDDNLKEIPINLILKCEIRTRNKTGIEFLKNFFSYLVN